MFTHFLDHLFGESAPVRTCSDEHRRLDSPHHVEQSSLPILPIIFLANKVLLSLASDLIAKRLFDQAILIYGLFLRKRKRGQSHGGAELSSDAETGGTRAVSDDSLVFNLRQMSKRRKQSMSADLALRHRDGRLKRCKLIEIASERSGEGQRDRLLLRRLWPWTSSLNCTHSSSAIVPNSWSCTADNGMLIPAMFDRESDVVLIKALRLSNSPIPLQRALLTP